MLISGDRFWRARRAALGGVMAMVMGGWLGPCEGYPLTPEQEAHLEATVPHFFAKLNAPGSPADRDSVVMVALGDSVTEYFHHDDSSYDSLDSYVGRLAEGLSREFFYSGGVRLVKPRVAGLPEKHDPYRGSEIILHNLARGGAHSIHSLRHLTTDAFLYEPALVVINYGINDALTMAPSAVYEQAISESLALCQEKETDVLLFGSSPILGGDGPLGLGQTRHLVAMGRKLATDKGGAFIDLGQGLVSGTLPRRGETPEEKLEDVGEQLEGYYLSETGREDFVHPNVAAHRKLGKYAYEVFMNGVPAPDYAGVGGVCRQVGASVFEVSFELENLSGEAREGVFGALESMGTLTPLEPYHEFSLAAGEKKTVTIQYELKATGVARDRAKFEGLPGDHSYFWFPFLISDDVDTRFLEVRADVKPVVVLWDTGLTDGVTGEMSLGCEVYNSGETALNGEYVVKWRGQEKRGQLAMGAGERLPLRIGFPLPGETDVVRMKNLVEMRVRVGSEEYLFKRIVELKRNLHLGERVSMARMPAYREGKGEEESGTQEGRVIFRAEADANALYLLFDIPADIELRDGPGGNTAILTDIMIDARSYDYLEDRSWGRRRDFGFVGVLRMGCPKDDGPGRADGIGQASFGNGYGRQLDRKQIKSVLETRSTGERRFTVTIPRVYFYHHEWQLGNANSQIGIDAVMAFAKEAEADGSLSIAPYDDELTYVLTRTVHHRSYASRLAVLELSSEGTGRWSVHLY